MNQHFLFLGLCFVFKFEYKREATAHIDQACLYLTHSTLNCRVQIIFIAQDKPFHVVKTVFEYSY